jgi:hypothetical protein
MEARRIFRFHNIANGRELVHIGAGQLARVAKAEPPQWCQVMTGILESEKGKVANVSRMAILAMLAIFGYPGVNPHAFGS